MLKKLKKFFPRKKKGKQKWSQTMVLHRARPRSRRKGWSPLVFPPLKHLVTFLRLSSFRTKARGSLFFLGIVLVGTAFGIVFFSPFFAISDVTVARTDLFINSAAVAKSLEGIKGKNLLFFDGKHVSEVIYSRFPEVKRVEVSRIYPSVMHVKVTSYDALARIKNEGEREYILNEAGYAVRSEQSQGDLPLIVIPSYKNIDPEEKELFEELTWVKEYKQMLTQEQLYLMMDAKKIFEDTFTLPVDTMYYYPIEDELRLHTQKNFLVWMSLKKYQHASKESFTEDKQFVEEQIIKLKNVLPHLNIYTEALRYIDLRIKNKVIYCKNGASCEKIMSAL
jgi:cell division septal protein FtsQ